MKYKWRTRPYRHQVRAVKFALAQFKTGLGVAFLMEPRTGKTKSTIDTLAILHLTKGVKKVLIVCPNRVIGTWMDEFGVHCSVPYHITDWSARTRRSRGRYQAIPQHQGSGLHVLLVNYETFATPGRRTKSGRRSKASGRFKHRTLIEKWLGHDPGAAVLDEGHKIKSPSGKASNMLVTMRPMFAYRFLLTGTPVTKAKRAHDIYMQWQWVNPDRFPWGQTVEDFKNHTGRWIGANGYPQWVAARDRGMEDLRRGIHRDGIVVHRADCFDLPPRQPRVVDVPLSPQTAHHYDEMAEEMVTKLKSGDIAEASIPLVVTLRLLQMTSGFVGVERRGRKLIARIGREKLAKLEELLSEEVVEQEQKVIIVARFKPDLNAIEKLCTQLGIRWWSIRGGVSRNDADAGRREFQAHTDGPAAMILQPQAASLGIDLRSANHMIWFSLTPSYVDFTQIEDRIALSERSTMYTYLLVPDSVDTLVYQTLQADGDVAKHIMTKPEAILRH